MSEGFEAFWIGVHEVLGVSEVFAVGAWGCCVGCLLVDGFSELVGCDLVGLCVGRDGVWLKGGGWWNWGGLEMLDLRLEVICP